MKTFWRETSLPSIGAKFSDPILWPDDAPIPVNCTNIRIVPRGEFEQAEMAAYDELPASLKRAFQHHGSSCVMQLVLKGLKFGEFSEDQVYLAILRSAPNPVSQLRRPN